MSFFKFKLDNAPVRSTPVPIAASCTSLPSAPQSHLKRSSSSLYASGQKSDTQLELREGQPTLVAEPDARLSLNDGRPRKRLAPVTPAVDSSFSPGSRKLDETWTSMFCFECKASKTRCEEGALGPGDVCSRCLRLSRQYFSDAEPASLASPVAKSPAVPSAKPPAKSGASKRPNGAVVPGETPVTRRQSTPEMFRSMEAEASSAFLSGLTNQLTSRSLSLIENKQLQTKIDTLIDRDIARKVFHHYVNTFAPKCPMVIFPPGSSSKYLRETKPILFLSILSVASGGYCPRDQQRELVLESKRALAEHTIVRGEKSLELVQALQIALLWYQVPDDYKQANLTQLARIMITMASDLGLNNAAVSQPCSRGPDVWDRAEAQRAWLGCFLLSSSISVILRRPIVMNWTSEMDVSLADLQKAEVSPSDAFFCELVMTERLCHTACQRLFLSDSDQSASACDPLTIRTAQDFQSRVNGWTSCKLNQLQHALVDFGRYSGLLYAYEPAMHVNRNLDEFEAPFAAKSLKTCTFINEQTDVPQLLMLRGIVTTSHEMLNIFLGLPVVDMLTLSPHIYGGRVIYSLILLCKLYKAITISAKDTTPFLLADELHLEEYLDRLTAVAKDLIVRDERNALSRSFLIIEQLRKWFHANKCGTSINMPNEPILCRRAYTEQPQLNAPAQHGNHGMEFQSDLPLHTPTVENHALLPSTLGDLPTDTEGRYDWFMDELFSIDMFN